MQQPDVRHSPWARLRAQAQQSVPNFAQENQPWNGTCLLHHVCLCSGPGRQEEEESFEEVAGGVCLQVYRETLRGVITACRRYKDELLEACLELVLSAPTPVMTIHVSCSAFLSSLTRPQSCLRAACFMLARHNHGLLMLNV